MERSEQNTETCRLCDEGGEKLYSIFEKNANGQQILQLIKECLPLIIYRTDPLSKKICEICYNKVDSFYDFKKTSLKIADKHLNQLKNHEDSNNKNIQLYLMCDGNYEKEINENNIPLNHNTVETSTEDLIIPCVNCKASFFDSTINTLNKEVELCTTDLRKAIADSLSNNKVTTSSSDNEKVLRSRRRRSQAFYHELDDSLCSSLTEFTNTESSQCYEEYRSDVEESYESDEDGENQRPSKRRKLNDGSKMMKLEVIKDDTQYFHEIFKEEPEYRYNPLSLMKLALNVINQMNLDDYEPEEDFYVEDFLPECTYCKETFKNSKLLALHEITHINIELGEKVDSPVEWHESRDDAEIRNKWLSNYEENEEEEPDLYDAMDEKSLLIPIGTEDPSDHPTAEIVLNQTKPYVNGIPLSEYTKEERKSFYKTMKLGGANKKFCNLCRYSFKDNWAIESHYFSSACYYTCRYCGMRFNKLRHRFDEHVEEHEKLGDRLSNKIFVACKLNAAPNLPLLPQDEKHEIVPVPPLLEDKFPKNKFFPRKTLQANLQIKEEPRDKSPVRTNQLTMRQTFPTNSSTPTNNQQPTSKNNQAYFCRKCYKVFFKLDEFNIHSKNCDYNQVPSSGGKSSSNSTSSKKHSSGTNGEVVPKQRQQAAPPPQPKPQPQQPPQEESYNASGRPQRNCVKEIRTYKDEAYYEPALIKETNPSNQSFVCFICNTPFPTIYSRNSHMRIHKTEMENNLPSTSQKSYQQQPLPQQPQQQQQDKNYHLNNSEITFTNYRTEPKIKQEPLEPEVEIHETEQNYNSNIGAVSITPISKNPNQKPTINPNIMKLVQSNPHLTIKANLNQSPDRSRIMGDDKSMSSSANNSMNSSMMNVSPDPDKSYKCSSCWESFNNKSNLYFHKKNQCEGSKYPCPFCKKRFGTESAYSSHIFYSHPE